MKINELIANWKYAKEQLDHFKNLEKELRDDIAKELIGIDAIAKEEVIVNDQIVKAKRGHNYSIDQKSYKNIRGDFTDDEKNCIRIKYELILSKYKKLDKEQRINLDECVVAKPGAPTVEVNPLIDVDYFEDN